MDAAMILPKTSLSLADARSRLSGLHFAKEALSEKEREILYIAEGLLRLIDESTPSPQMSELRDLITKPGVLGVNLWPHGVEVFGSEDDSDAQAGFVSGVFNMDEVREAVGPHLPLDDCR